MELSWEQNMRLREVEALESIEKNTSYIRDRLVEIKVAIDCIGG